MKKAIYISIILSLPFISIGQNEAFKSEFYGGLILHTSGWGGNLTHSKYLNSSSRQIIEVDLVSMRHPKQQKIRVTPREKRFVYGMLNSIYVLRGGFGRKTILSQNYNKKGVEISMTYTGGLSIAAVKPVYINVVNPFSPQTPTLERYNPEEHNLGEIYSGGPNFSGLNKISPIFGAYAKIGFMIDYSPYKNYVRAIEVGAKMDYFLSPIEIMAFNKNNSLFPNLYLKLLFGRIYK